MAVIVVLVAVLMLIPASIQLTANNQLPMSQQAAFSQQALQGARAGLSDYIDWAQSHSNYPSTYCSSGVTSSWTCPSGKTADSTNPAFANAALASKWIYTQGSSTSSPSVAYQYLVNSSALSAFGTGNFTVYATGRAGDPGHWVYQTIQATVQFGAYATSSGGSSPGCTPVTTYLPSSTTLISVTAVGAEGGGNSGGVGDGGDGAELGATVTDSFPVSPGSGGYGWGTPPYPVTLMPGSPGYSGSYHLLSLAAMGGSGGCGAQNLYGGNGGGQGLGISTEFGGGGGAASTLCFGTASQCTSETAPKPCNPSMQIACMLAIAGGGGGAGGQNSLGVAGGSGGYYPAAYTGNGGNGSTILGLGTASGGTLGGNNQLYGANGGGSLLGALNGSGGGGGGGYLKGGSGGQAGLLGLGLGSSGGGGGAGDSAVSPTPISCNSSPAVSNASSSVYDSNGDGIVSIQVYAGSTCLSLGLPSLAVLEVQQIDANSALQ